MLEINLDAETEKYLSEILDREKISSEELVKRLVRDCWLAMQPRKTILERLEQIESLPGKLPNSPGNLSDRDVRRKVISEYLQKRQQRRQQRGRQQREV